MANQIINTIEGDPILRSPDAGYSGSPEISAREGVEAGVATVQPDPIPVVEEVAPVVEVEKTVPSFRIGYPGTLVVDISSHPQTPILILNAKLANEPIPSGV